MKNILVAINFDHLSEQLMQKATEIAEKFGSKIWLVHVASEFDTLTGNKAASQTIRDNRAQILRAEHPKMKALKDQIYTLKFNLERQLENALKRFQSSYQALKRKEDAIERVTENIQSEKMLSPTKESEYLRLKNHEAQLQRKYDLVYERVLASTGAIDGFSFITIQEPYIFRDPIAPDKVKLLAIGPFAGLAIGIAIVLLRWFVVPIAIVLLKEFKEYYKASGPTLKL